VGAPKRALPPALAANRWRPGQSGNPSGNSGEYGTAIKLAQRAAPQAVRRLIELMDSEDERVAAVACNSILDRVFGKAKAAEEAKDDLVARVEAMTPRKGLGWPKSSLSARSDMSPPSKRLWRSRKASD